MVAQVLSRVNAWLRAWIAERVRQWRSGSTRSQLFLLFVLLICTGLSWLVSWNAYGFMPLTAYFVWLLAGMLTLRFYSLAVLTLAAFAAGLSGMIHDPPFQTARAAAIAAWLIFAALILVHSSRQRTGLPVSLSENLLVDLRDRLRSQGSVPELRGGWRAQSAMLASHGVGYAGDFLVADVSEDGRSLELVLVDVCGKGVAAGAQALHFAGALGGLVGALPQPAFFHAANAFLLRQGNDDSFSTAVHLAVDLDTGRYQITSAGHPPALRWDHTVGEWLVDPARGMALGILPEPELASSRGTVAPGEALLFYTDGVVESRRSDLDTGIAWLRETAREAIKDGYADAPRKIVRKVKRGDDDRAVIILSRGDHPVPEPEPAAAAPATQPNAEPRPQPSPQPS